MAATNGQETTPRGKAKKKSALTKLVERKKRQVGAADANTKYGSSISLQGNGRDIDSEMSHIGPVPAESEVIMERKMFLGTACVPCKSRSSDSAEKPRPTPRRNSRTSFSDNSSGLSQSAKNDRKGAGDSAHERDDDPGGAASIGSLVPTDTTIYKFRNMRMAAEHQECAESRLHGPFVPKPPSTPRSPSTTQTKGEKRNHESCSGEEAEVNSKRLTPESERGRDLAAGASHDLETQSMDHERGHKSSIDKQESDPASDTISQLHSQYQQLMDADNMKDSPLSLRRNSLASQHPDSASVSTLHSGRLAPLEVKNPPPPLEADVVSPALRTAYKADPSYRAPSSNTLGRLMKRGLSDGALLSQGTGSPSHVGSVNTSVLSSGVMQVITTQEARSRSFLQGSITASTMSIMGSSELDRYFPDRRCHIFVGSWNMNEIKLLPKSLDDFILPETCPYIQDIYAIGTQENEINKKEWEIHLQETLGPSHVLYHSVTYGCLHLALFIRRDLIWYCSAPEDANVSLRALAMVKTKGAIGISFSLFGTSFLFINCHLTSDRSSNQSKSRLLDYHQVTQQLQLPHIPPGKHVHPALQSPDVTARFDSVFWCGDLNFRLERRRDAVVGRVSEYNDSSAIPHFEELLKSDQLSNFITEGKIFDGFQEGRINFQPTFKFDIGSDTYDTSNKSRIPSYTDRVLFRSRKKNQIACLHYDAVKDIRVSDHRPVFARFECVLRPGRDNITISAGKFDREVYIEANQRRAQLTVAKGQKSSTVCVIQ